MKYQLVIFDCDGTLVDTLSDVARCFSEALVSCGFSACQYESVARLVGKPLEEIVAGLLTAAGDEHTDEDVARVADAYRAIYSADPKMNTQPFPGMSQLVDILLDDGVKVGVNSNKIEGALITLIGACFPGREVISTGYSDSRPVKPDPAGALEIARRAGVSAEDSLYVGDTHVDAETASNAGMDCAIMTWGQGTADLYAQPELIACCDNAEELLAVITG